ncbi:MAG: hypothetical protein AAF701_05125 [Pseudomonadota bacterium]
MTNCILLVLSALVWAGTATAENTPLSAIDWLRNSSTVEQPNAVKPTAIGDIMGILEPDVLQADAGFWADTDPDRLQALGQSFPQSPLPVLADLAQRLVLARLAAPQDVNQARIAFLMTRGALDAAWVMARPLATDVAYFDMARDIAVLSGHDREICQIWADHPGWDHGDAVTQIYCLTATDQWDAAALALITRDALGDLTPVQSTLLTVHIDPDLAEGTNAPNIPPSNMTPLLFRLAESAGYIQPTRPLPLPYAVADLRDTRGWKSQLNAAERLYKAGSLTGNELWGIYAKQTPSASGGIWDRAQAMQDMRANPGPKPAQTLWDVMHPVGLTMAAAQIFADDMIALPSSPAAQHMAILATTPPMTVDQITTALPNANPQTIAAITAGLTADIPPRRVIAQAILDILDMAPRIQERDLNALIDAIGQLKALGLDRDAQALALQYVVLIDPKT